jgi:hypothetical protein
VTRNSNGTASIASTGSDIGVPSFSMPSAAAQKGTAFPLDTLDARLTQAVSAVDPSTGTVAIWTQHTVAGGAVSKVSWYEINPTAARLVQLGVVANPTMNVFNGAVSPDRAVNGTSTAFGSDMVLGFDTSSTTTYPAVRMVSKIGAFAESAWVTIQRSPGPDLDFSCSANGVCRWGDYAAATPDPAAPTTGATGNVWLTSMWTADGRVNPTGAVVWRTWNWEAAP